MWRLVTLKMRQKEFQEQGRKETVILKITGRLIVG